MPELKKRHVVKETPVMCSSVKFEGPRQMIPVIGKLFHKKSGSSMNTSPLKNACLLRPMRLG